MSFIIIFFSHVMNNRLLTIHTKSARKLHTSDGAALSHKLSVLRSVPFNIQYLPNDARLMHTSVCLSRYLTLSDSSPLTRKGGFVSSINTSSAPHILL